MALFKHNATSEEVSSWCEKEFGKAHDARQTLERQWLLNLAFYYGKQWMVWGPNIGSVARLSEPKAPAWRVRLTVNKIQPYVRREMARMSSQKPRGFVMPISSDEEDRSAARVAESLLDFLHEELELEAVMDLADWWCCIAGSCAMKVRYSEEIDLRTNQPGLLAVDVIRPFDLYVPDLEEVRIRKQRWVAHVQSLSIQEIRDTWGVDVSPDESTSEVDSKVRNVMSVFNQSKGDEYAVVKEFWIRPCREYPNGLVVATCNNKVLPFVEPPRLQEFDEATGESLPPEPMAKIPKGTIEWPYGHGRLPFIMRGHTMSGRFYDTSFVEQLISLQREYNRTRSQIIENKNITSRPQWAMVAGSVDRSQLTTEPGAVIEYAPGFNPPAPIQAPTLPNYVIEHTKLMASEMDEIASQNEVSKGSVPPGVQAATAIAYLQERDDSALTYGIRNKERALQEAGQQLLALVTEFWDIPRMIRVVGQNEVFDSYMLKGEDLRDNCDYRVVSGSGTPVSRAAQKAEIMEYVNAGMIPGAKALRMLNMPDVASLVEEVERDLVQAGKENLVMSKGQMSVVEIWHDHVAHVDEHDSYKKREEYEHLDQQIKDIFRFHDYQHLQQLAMLFNIPVPMENPQVNMFRQLPPEQGGNPNAIDPMVEFELRKIYIQLKAGGGGPAPAPQSQGNPPA